MAKRERPERPEDPTAPVSAEVVYDIGMAAARSYLRTTGRGGGREAEDMIGDALEGAWKAQESYDPEVGGTRFGYTYAKARFAIIDGLRARGHYTRNQLAQGLHQDPDSAPEQLRPPVSLDAIQARLNVDNTGSGRVLEFPDPQAQRPAKDFEDRETIAQVLPLARPDHAEVLRRHFLEGETLASIGDDLGVTESRVCQIKATALRHLRKALQDEDLDALVA